MVSKSCVYEKYLMLDFPNHALYFNILVIHVEKVLTAARVGTLRNKITELLCDLFIC